jgi:hypothetical protein
MCVIAVLESFQDGVDNRLAVIGSIVLVSRGIAERIGLGGEPFYWAGTKLSRPTRPLTAASLNSSGKKSKRQLRKKPSTALVLLAFGSYLIIEGWTLYFSTRLSLFFPLSFCVFRKMSDLMPSYSRISLDRVFPQ